MKKTIIILVTIILSLSLTGCNDSCESEISELKQNIETLNNELTQKDNELSSKNDLISNKDQLISNIQNEVDSLQNDKGNLEDDLSDLQSELETTIDDKIALDNELNEVQNENEILSQELYDLKYNQDTCEKAFYINRLDWVEFSAVAQVPNYLSARTYMCFYILGVVDSVATNENEFIFTMYSDTPYAEIKFNMDSEQEKYSLSNIEEGHFIEIKAFLDYNNSTETTFQFISGVVVSYETDTVWDISIP